MWLDEMAEVNVVIPPVTSYRLGHRNARVLGCCHHSFYGLHSTKSVIGHKHCELEHTVQRLRIV